jgi:hypothetical protein
MSRGTASRPEEVSGENETDGRRQRDQRRSSKDAVETKTKFKQRRERNETGKRTWTSTDLGSLERGSGYL